MKEISLGFMITQSPPTLTGERVSLTTTITSKTAWQCGEVLLLAFGMMIVAMHGISTSARKMLVGAIS